MKTLVLKDVETTDELQKFGLELASKFGECDHVALIHKSGLARYVKGGKGDEIFYFDPYEHEPIYDLIGSIQKIKAIYEEVHPDTADLSHAFVGQWLFHWRDPMGNNTLALVKDVDRLIFHADSFIEADFGQGRPGTLYADGRQRREADKAPEGISSADGTGVEVRPNS